MHQTYLLEGREATNAGAAGAAVDRVPFLERAGIICTVAVVPDRRSPRLDRITQDSPNGRRETTVFFRVQLACLGSRVDARLEERFVGVDVADTGEATLVQQRGFDGLARSAECIAELSGVDRQRVDAESGPAIALQCVSIRNDPDPAEPSRIAVGEPSAAHKTPYEVDVVGAGQSGAVGDVDQLA